MSVVNNTGLPCGNLVFDDMENRSHISFGKFFYGSKHCVKEDISLF